MLAKILVVDDNLTNLQHISSQLSSEYNVVLAKSGRQALNIAARQLPDLILLDVEMPEIDGFETFARLRQNIILKRIPVIFLTANHDSATEIKALDSGAKDFITKPYEKNILLHRIELHLRYSRYQKHLENTVKELEDSIVISFAELIEFRDEDTGGHVQRTSEYVAVLGKALREKGLFTDELHTNELLMMVRAAPLHDIGKIGISDDILLKPGKLTVEEFAIMREHPIIGSRLLKSMYERVPTQQYLDYAEKIAASHHERFDGKGYPYGLSGEDIPLCSRIMAVADVYDALASDRIYRKAMSHDQACRIIIDGKGTAFDPRIVEVFEETHQEFAKRKKSDISNTAEFLSKMNLL